MDHTGSNLTQARVPQFFPEGACVVAVDRAVCALSTEPKPGGLDCPEATRPRPPTPTCPAGGASAAMALQSPARCTRRAAVPLRAVGNVKVKQKSP